MADPGDWEFVHTSGWTGRKREAVLGAGQGPGDGLTAEQSELVFNCCHLVLLGQLCPSVETVQLGLGDLVGGASPGSLSFSFSPPSSPPPPKLLSVQAIGVVVFSFVN